jgi:polyphosphate kinase 2 (PPK2 family)
VKIAPLDNKAYEKALRKLHVELVKLQRWVVHKGYAHLQPFMHHPALQFHQLHVELAQRLLIRFIVKRGAGKGGTIKAITERVSPRIFRVVALPSPTEREKSQLKDDAHLQPFMHHPALQFHQLHVELAQRLLIRFIVNFPPPRR